MHKLVLSDDAINLLLFAIKRNMEFNDADIIRHKRIKEEALAKGEKVSSWSSALLQNRLDLNEKLEEIRVLLQAQL